MITTLYWILPFVGLVLSLALIPLAAPKFWRRHYGKITAFWTMAFLLPALWTLGLSVTKDLLFHTLLREYIPFIIATTAIFVVTNHIRLEASLRGTPLALTLLLAVGALLANIIGTTGASMLLIQPLLQAIQGRTYRTHIVIFFIFLVSNIGGLLTPMGDAPIFLGFLKGVPFGWPLVNLWAPFLVMMTTTLGVFYIMDRILFQKESPLPRAPRAFHIHGKINFLFLSGIVLTFIFLPPVWGNLSLILLTLGSWFSTSPQARKDNHFSWSPIAEVARLFLGIFLTLIPAILLLKAGPAGPFECVFQHLQTNGQPNINLYFWLSGLFSAIVDNAPTYLVFFNLAGGNTAELIAHQAGVLAAISAGSVFMGALTYIGNTPNFLVKAIAEKQGIPMPSFFGYMLWSVPILVPLFWLTTFFLGP